MFDILPIQLVAGTGVHITSTLPTLSVLYKAMLLAVSATHSLSPMSLV